MREGEGGRGKETRRDGERNEGGERFEVKDEEKKEKK